MASQSPLRSGWQGSVSIPTLVIASIMTLFALLPLIGLFMGLLDPLPSAFETEPKLAGILRRSGTFELLGNTFFLAAAVSLIAVPLGTWLGWVEQRTQYPGVKILGVLGLLPLAMPSYILASTVRESFGPGGAVGKLLGLPVFTGFAPAILVLSVITVPYVQLLVSATLMRSSAAEEEAARVLGASPLRVFTTVILPRLRPTLAFSLLITSLYVISDFGAVAVLDCPVLTWRLYQAVNHQQLATAVVLGSAILVLTIPLLISARALHGTSPQTSSVSNPRPIRRRGLSYPMLALTFAAHIFVIGTGVLVPIATLGDWVCDGIIYGERFASLWIPIRDTLLASFAGAIIATLLAIVPAWVAARGPRRISWWIEQGTYLTSALPGVLIAFGLLLASLYVSRTTGGDAALYAWITASGVLLMMGYSMRFMAEAYAGLKTAILGLDPRHEACARTLGAPRSKWLTHVVVPAVRPGLVAAFLLVLLALIKELPVTLLLGGAMGLRTLAFRTYDRYQEAFLHDAGLTGFVILAIAFSGVALSLRWRRHV